VTEVENDILIAPFTEEEARAAIIQMEHNKACEPDAFIVEFYQAFWHLIKDDIMSLFSEFH
jgi:hypothetical protein